MTNVSGRLKKLFLIISFLQFISEFSRNHIGCGHGGHLACAQEWFGGVDSYGEPSMRPQEFCPTGCGHKCNFSKKMWNSPSKRHSLSSTSQMAIA